MASKPCDVSPVGSDLILLDRLHTSPLRLNCLSSVYRPISIRTLRFTGGVLRYPEHVLVRLESLFVAFASDSSHRLSANPP